MSKAKQKPVRKKYSRKQLYLACVGWMCLGLFFIIIPNYDIHFYSQEPIAATGKVEDVKPYHSGYLEVCVDGNGYVLHKEIYSTRSFGIMENMKLGELQDILNGKVGLEAELEYVEMGSGEKRIMGLSINGVEYIDKDVAIRDTIGDDNDVRIFGAVIFALAAVLLLLARKGIIS